MDSDSDEDASPAPHPRVAGSILRVSVRDFMQFTSCSFRPGPNLNVVLGPNGSGKSSLVLAIGLCLGGRPHMLGRATHLGEYVRLGAEAAHIEVEVVGGSGPGGKNIVVERSFTKEGRS